MRDIIRYWLDSLQVGRYSRRCYESGRSVGVCVERGRRVVFTNSQVFVCSALTVGLW